MKSIYIGARELALPIPRKGSIETHSGYGSLARAGQKDHDSFLRRRKRNLSQYSTELKLDHKFEHEGYEIRVSGRVDGAVTDESDRPVRLEEIKTDHNLEYLRGLLDADSEHPYWLQLKVYGYICQIENGLIPQLDMIVVSQRDGSSKTMTTELDIEQFEDWLSLRLDEVIAEHELHQSSIKRRKEIARRVQFPFSELRKGQQELMDEVSATVDGGGRLAMQAPTGLGKTMGVMFPSLQGSLQRGGQLVYVTAKNSQHLAARNAAELMSEREPELRTLVLTAKAKLCMKDEVLCNPDYCEYARDYYSKVHAKDLISQVADRAVVDREVLESYAKEHEVCPFELSLDAIKHIDLVVGDYNYVFSPRNITGRFQYSLTKKRVKPNLVIDEAHNLPSRAESYYSASISTEQLKSIRRSSSKLAPHVAFALDPLIDQCIDLIGEGQASQAAKGSKDNGRSRGAGSGDHLVEVDRERVASLASKLAELAGEYVASATVVTADDPILTAHRLIEAFSAVLDFTGEQFKTLYKRNDGGTLKVTCCDASEFLADSYKLFNSTVAFSATLKPFDYYCDLMGIKDKTFKSCELASPFPLRNRKLMVIPQVSTRYTDRSRNYAKIADAVKRIVAVRQGNYIVFFPSFQFLQSVQELTDVGSSELIAQERGMTADAVDEVLERLRDRDRPTVLFAVQGGVFAEGVDYPGEMLSGTLIVGPGVPGYDAERQTLIEYYEQRYGKGSSYGLVYPAMTKVVQSAGRVIRSETDRGLIVLLDRRFVNDEYSSVMPTDWFDKSVGELVSSSVLADIDQFWKESRESE